MRRGYAGMLSLWVQHTLRGRVFDSIQKLDGAGQDALRTGQVISRTNSDLQQVHTLLQMCPVPLAVFTYYIAGIAVMLWMSPAMTLIVVCVLVCPRRSPRFVRVVGVFAQTGLASDQLANLTEHIREVLAQISVVKSCVAEMRETHWLDRQSRQIVRVRIGAVISQAMPWGHHAGATGARANRPAVLRRVVGHARADRSRYLRCIRQLPRDADRANPRTGIVSGYRTAHSGVRGAGVCTDRHPFTDGGRDGVD